MKKLLSLFLAIISVLLMLPMNAFADQDDFYTVTFPSNEGDTTFYLVGQHDTGDVSNSLQIRNNGNTDTPKLTFALENGEYIKIDEVSGDYMPAAEFDLNGNVIPDKNKRIRVYMSAPTDLPVGNYSDRLIVTEEGTGIEHSIDVMLRVIKRNIQVNCKINNAQKYEGMDDPEFTYEITSCSEPSYDPVVVGDFVRDEGEEPGDYVIRMENARVENDISDDTKTVQLKITNGWLFIDPISESYSSDVLDIGGLTDGWFNDKPVIITPKVDCEYDLISIDGENWVESVEIYEEGKSIKTYTLYLKNSYTNKVTYSDIVLKFDNVTEPECSIEIKDNYIYISPTMKNLKEAAYRIDDGEEKMLSMLTSPISMSAGIHDYTVILIDCEGNRSEILFEDVASFAYFRFDAYDENGYISTYEVSVRYGEYFVFPEDCYPPEALTIVGWIDENGNELEFSFPVTEELFDMNYIKLRPILAYPLPEELIAYQPPEYLEYADLMKIKEVLKAIEAFRKEENYYYVTEVDEAVLTAYEDMLYGVLSTVERVYRDVKDNDWYAESVNYCFGQGIMTGVGDHRFAPQTELNRAMFAMILWNMEGKPAPEGGSYYTDVRDGSWFTEAVNWAHESGIVAGMGNGRFDPGGKLTREQLAAMMYRYTEYKGRKVTLRADLSDYADKNKISDWAYESMSWAVAKKLISGRTETTLAPKGTATRAETAQIVYNYKR